MSYSVGPSALLPPGKFDFQTCIESLHCRCACCCSKGEDSFHMHSNSVVTLDNHQRVLYM